MKRIEKGLHEHHANLQAAEAAKQSLPIPDPQPVERPFEPEVVTEPPFATVNAVENGSPAHEAGLKAGDSVRSFGSANWQNHENLRKVGEIVQRNEGVSSSKERSTPFTNSAS